MVKENVTKDNTLNWLMESNSWTKYGVLKNILDIKDQEELKSAKRDLLNEPNVQKIILELNEWYPDSYTRHNDPKISHYKLMLLAEFGLTIDDPGIKEIIDKVKLNMDNDLYAMKQSLPERGGDLPVGWYALPCDSPIILYSLLLMGDRSSETLKAVDILAEKWKDPTGWFCNFFFVKGQFKKLNASCPMAGLMALQVFSLVDKYKESKSAENAFNSLVFHKDLKKNLYFFGRSKKFWTFKYPFVWYNAFYMAYTVSRFKQFKNSDLFNELREWICKSLDENGYIKATSMFRIYKEWDFANKKDPSPWLTYLANRILFY